MVRRDRASAAATRSPSPARSSIASRRAPTASSKPPVSSSSPAYAIEQLGPLALRERVGVPERPRVLRRRLAVRERLRRASPGGAGVLEHRVVVARLLGVMGEARGIARRDERAQDLGVQRPAAVRRDVLRDREPGELVAERDGVRVGAEHAGREAGVELLELPRGDRLEQPQLGARRDHRDDLEQPARRLAEERDAREHRVPDRLGQLVAARGEDLRHVEGVALRAAVDRVAVGAVRRRELAHGVEREPRHRQSHDSGRRRELAENGSERVPRGDLVVAVGGEHE